MGCHWCVASLLVPRCCWCARLARGLAPGAQVLLPRWTPLPLPRFLLCLTSPARRGYVSLRLSRYYFVQVASTDTAQTPEVEAMKQQSKAILKQLDHRSPAKLSVDSGMSTIK